jgi:hypothetical protein
MKNYVLFLFFFPISILNAQLKKSNFPKWVEIINYNNLPTIDESDISQGLLALLFDQQINETKKEVFYRYATKITENVGVQAGSTINISFDPSYQKLEIHEIKIKRNGKIIDKLKIADFQLIRREMNAENYIYDGSLSAILNLSDVRINDIIDYSFTIKGFNHVHNNHFSTYLYLNSYEPIGKLNTSIITSKELNFEYLNTKKQFKKSKKNNTNFYKISNKNIKPYVLEENTPLTEIILSTVYISDYDNWKQVTDWGVNTFKVNDNPSKKLLKKINEIKKENNTEGQKINATLNFIQDEVRYLGLESGIGAYKPHSPNKVFNQRFGDCKDKSLLMVTMLKKMNIEAYPMLVNTYLGKKIIDLLPGHNLFDHCVVKVKAKNGRDLWYDPTISNQGGDFTKVTFPDYKAGLVLKKGNDKFDEIDPQYDNSIEVTDNYVIEEVGKGAKLNTVTVYTDSEADLMRTYFQNNSINSIKKKYETFYANYFFGIKSLENPKFEDDIDKNIFKTFETYKIDSIWKPYGDNNTIITNFYPYSIINTLSMPTKLERTRPYLITYPATRKHKINVNLPQSWSLKNEYFDIVSNSFYYDYDVVYNDRENHLAISHFLRMQENEVTENEFTEFYNNITKIDNNLVYGLTIPKNGSQLSGNSSFNWQRILGFLIFIGAIILAVFVGKKLYKYDPEPIIESYYENNKIIGGWLILIAIGLFISPFRVVYEIFILNPTYINGDWLSYLNFSNGFNNFLIGVVIFFELLVNVFIIIIFPILIMLFFKKRSNFSKLYSFILIGHFIFIVFDTFIASALIDVELNEKETTELIRAFISTTLISAYLLMSERSKETFVKRYKGGNGILNLEE